jgi:exodeoxyribonuclease VII small subunit
MAKVTKKKTTTAKDFDFEATLAELEELVERMEQGEMPLEDSLRDFERGIALTRQCQQALKDAEQKVQQLSAKQADADLQPFDSDD